MGRTNKVSFKTLNRILESRHRRILNILVAARVIVNLLDLVGLAGVALLVTSLASASSGSATNQVALSGIDVGHLDELGLVSLAGVVVAVFILKSVMGFYFNLISSRFVAQIEVSLASTLASEFLRPGSASAGSASLPDFQNRILYSVNAISLFINARNTLIAESSLLLMLVASFFVVNPTATGGLIVYLAAVLFALNFLISKRISRNGERQAKGIRETLRHAKDIIGVTRELRTSGLLGNWMDSLSGSRRDAAEGAAMVYTLGSAPRYAIETSLVLGVFGFLGSMIIFSDIQSQAATIAIFLAGGLRLMAALLPIQSALNQMREGAALGRVAFAELLRIRDQFDSTPTESSRPNLDTRAIVLERVFMRFPGQSKEALHDISLSISSGEQVAIVGPSGAGKSTIVDLICGHLEPTAGHVLIHGQPPGRFHALHPRSMAVVPQRPNTVNGSLFENVSLEPLERTDIDRAIDAMRRSSLDHLTNNSSVEAPISQLGEANLSGGELQRLGLARALYATPTILLLDEATSALDAETEGAVSDFVDQLRGVTTVLIVAHRLSTVRNADRVVYVDEGKIIDVGKFDELTARVPGFARAVDLLGLGSE